MLNFGGKLRRFDGKSARFCVAPKSFVFKYLFCFCSAKKPKHCCQISIFSKGLVLVNSTNFQTCFPTSKWYLMKFEGFESLTEHLIELRNDFRAIKVPGNFLKKGLKWKFFRIFLSLRFYVKSIFHNLEVVKLLFLQY